MYTLDNFLHVNIEFDLIISRLYYHMKCHVLYSCSGFVDQVCQLLSWYPACILVVASTIWRRANVGPVFVMKYACMVKTCCSLAMTRHTVDYIINYVWALYRPSYYVISECRQIGYILWMCKYGVADPVFLEHNKAWLDHISVCLMKPDNLNLWSKSLTHYLSPGDGTDDIAVIEVEMYYWTEN